MNIRIGIIGAGANTKLKHIPGLRAMEGVEIVGVCNRSRESSERAAAELGIPQVYDNWQELIGAPDVDAVVIGTWPYLHCRATVAALEAGKHVLCEARMAMNASEAHTMLDAAQARPHLTAQIVPSPFTLKVDGIVKRMIAEGFLGDILVIEVRAGGSFIDRDAPMHWREDFELSGYNTMSLGILCESIMRWVGVAKAVTAMSKTFVTERKDSEGNIRPIYIPDHVDVTVDMKCGAQMHMQISSVTGLAGGMEVFLFGSNGTLRFSDKKLYCGARDDNELSEIRVPADEEGRWRVEEEFIRAIQGKEAVTLTTFEDGVKYMEFTEAVIRSTVSGCKVNLPLF